MRLSTWAWTETSSAEVGSSQMMNSGRLARARAMAMRWRCPPENWCGYLRASSGFMRTRRSASCTRSAVSSLPAVRASTCRGSAISSCTVQRGFRLAYGSWKIIWKRRRMATVWAAGLHLSTPSNSTVPLVGGVSPATMRATVDLPEPDSPTRPKVEPLRIEKPTPSTALRIFLSSRASSRASQPLDRSNSLHRSLTSSRAAAGSGAPAPGCQGTAGAAGPPPTSGTGRRCTRWCTLGMAPISTWV